MRQPSGWPPRRTTPGSSLQETALAIHRPRPAAARPLCADEIAELSPGLWRALAKAGVTPRVRAQAHPAAYLVALWRGARPVMAVGRTIWWPHAADNFAGAIQMSVLQHELQHLLDYAEGRLSIAGYLLDPHNWTYRYDLSRVAAWADLGAEQRASMAENLWRLERSGDAVQARRLRALIPWARMD